MKKSIAIVVTVLITVILCGCSGKSDAPGSTSPGKQIAGGIIDPCEVLSKAEAQQFVGEPIKDAEKKDTPAVGLKLCFYKTVAEGTGHYVQVGVTQTALMPNNGQTPKSIYESLRNNFSNAPKVTGIGDEAFAAPPGLHILKGSYYVTVAVGGSDAQKLKSAGELAIRNLEKLSGK